MEITDKTSYEEALNRLKDIVESLEKKEIKIDNLSETVIEAKALVEFCKKKLDKTEEDIKRIIEPSSSEDE